MFPWTSHGAPNLSKDMLAVLTVFYFEHGARVAPITNFTRSGLINMAARLAALGGRLEVHGAACKVP
jgi:hypothetical protein